MPNHKTREATRKADKATKAARRRESDFEWRREVEMVDASFEARSEMAYRDSCRERQEPEFLESIDAAPGLENRDDWHERELNALRSEEASRRCRERDAIEWGERFGPAAHRAVLLPANPVSGMGAR